MVRIVALGLLIACITPTALASSSRINIKEDAPSICKDQGSLSCSTQKKPSKADIHKDLWLQNIAETILPDSPFLVCDRRTTGRGKQSWKTNLSLSPLRAIANTCGFTWQQQLNRQLTASESKPASNMRLKPKSVQKYKTSSKFPPLSRSSLIVAFPQSNSTFIPRNTKLANPAPATKRIASPFGWRTRPYSNQLQFHQGIDYGAPYGSTVVSVGNGIVTRVVSGCADFGNLFCGGQLGNWIEVDHGNGIIGTYGHLKRSSISVTEGMKVSKNQPIAQVGSSGWSTGAHLDFRLKVNGKHENPAKYVMAIEQPRRE